MSGREMWKNGSFLDVGLGYKQNNLPILKIMTVTGISFPIPVYSIFVAVMVF